MQTSNLKVSARTDWWRGREEGRGLRGTEVEAKVVLKLTTTSHSMSIMRTLVAIRQWNPRVGTATIDLVSKVGQKGARVSGASRVRGLHKPMVVGMGPLRLRSPPSSFPFTDLKTSCKSLSKASPSRDLLDKAVEVQLLSKK